VRVCARQENASVFAYLSYAIALVLVLILSDSGRPPKACGRGPNGRFLQNFLAI
jgi:hypothetical protein